MWKHDKNGTVADHWIDLVGLEGYEENGQHWWHASVRFDGCIHLNHAGNFPFSNTYGLCGQTRDENACDDYIHICDIDQMIEMLTKLKAEAKKHFGEDWPN